MKTKEGYGKELPWTGERCVPCLTDSVAVEHLHRYHLACSLAKDKDVLDIACGEGYGSDWLARAARRVVGVDICPETVAHAQNKYGSAKLTFREGNCAAIPLESSSVDLVVSFETIEHHDKHQEMMAEIKRVLRPGGLMILSSPNKYRFSDLPGLKSPYHPRELYLDEFKCLVRQFFRTSCLLGQAMCDGSAILPIERAPDTVPEMLEGNFADVARTGWESQSMYFIALASDEAVLPGIPVGCFDACKLSPTRRELLAEIQAGQERIQSGQECIVKLRSELLERNGQLAAMERSRSWRMTSILRKMRAAARRWRKRAGVFGGA